MPKKTYDISNVAFRRMENHKEKTGHSFGRIISDVVSSCLSEDGALAKDFDIENRIWLELPEPTMIKLRGLCREKRDTVSNVVNELITMALAE